jgi:hypothetical protein
VSVEQLMARIGDLQSERERLRDTGADELELERNRAEIAQLQWRLSEALIERYLPHAA